jgi:2-iminoacetate synthase
MRKEAGAGTAATFIDETAIHTALQAAATKDAARVRDILSRARELKGLPMDDVAVLTSVSDPELLAEMFQAAKEVKDAIYGPRLVLFAPLYVSNLCSNDCLYCAFRVRNK